MQLLCSKINLNKMKNPNARAKKISFKNQFLDSWWVLFFALLCFICYEQGIKMWSNQFNIFNAQLQELQAAKAKALREHEMLLALVHSQEDNDWIELTLMKELGMVPEGHRKVLFTK